MEFLCQKESVNQMKVLADSDRHSILISGVIGCGKTYLASQFARMKHVDDFILVNPTVSDIRNAVETCINFQNKVVICVENLDVGVPGASYSLLKFLEEPMDHVYIVVTCRNSYKVPDTIISRSAVINMSPPRSSDVRMYAKNIHPTESASITDNALWECCRSFKDVDTICKMTKEQLKYFSKLNSIRFNDAVSNIVWSLGHFEDNTETPVQIVIQYIITATKSQHIKEAGIDCLKDLSSGRIAAHTVLTKFVFECKYVE